MSKSEIDPLVPAIWRLRAGLEKKFAKGHPWVFSNDLDQSPKGLPPGAIVELRDSRDGFLALGYGNPSTLISFRTLSRQPVKSLVALMEERLNIAAQLRQVSAVDRFSHRLLFGEADGVPGIIVDRYLIVDSVGKSELAQVFVVQSSTAGGDRILPALQEALMTFSTRATAFAGNGGKLKSLTVLAQDSSSRAIEGLSKKTRETFGEWGSIDPKSATIAVQGGESAIGESLALSAAFYDIDFLEGQKTGFFLDQRMNVRLAWPAIQRAGEAAARSGRELKVLDLFSYVGQWSVQISRAVGGSKTRITMADASAPALEFAARNTTRAGGQAQPEKMDILSGISNLPVGAYDIVVCDPPAFIKKKKDIPTGRAAYVKLNREAMKRVAPGGVFISCSCSGLLTDEEFVEVLADAKRVSGREIRWIAHGGHGEDHPFRSEFPQGRYLKGWIGIVQ